MFTCYVKDCIYAVKRELNIPGLSNIGLCDVHYDEGEAIVFEHLDEMNLRIRMVSITLRRIGQPEQDPCMADTGI